MAKKITPEEEPREFRAIAAVAAEMRARWKLDLRVQKVKGTAPSGDAWFERYTTAHACLVAAMHGYTGGSVPKPIVARANALIGYVYDGSVECQRILNAKIAA